RARRAADGAAGQGQGGDQHEAQRARHVGPRSHGDLLVDFRTAKILHRRIERSLMDRWPNSPVRYPDPAVQVLDPSFAPYRLPLAAVERLATGLPPAEGPVWFGDGRFLLWSGIPNNRVQQ